MRTQASEHQIQNQIIAYLKYKGYYVFRMNAGAIRSTNSHGKTDLIRLHPPGTPDLLAIKNGGATFLEVKAKGNKPTTLQNMKLEELRSYGCPCLVVYSLEDVQKSI